MNLFMRIFVATIVVSSFIVTPDISLADSIPKPAAASFYPLIGKWHGQGEIKESGKAPAKMTLTLNCRKVAAGWAVACSMTAKNKKLSISESDLMGVDAATGEAHWYAITNMGETHDHLVNWINAKTMHAHYSWEQDGKKMFEEITFNINKRSMSFHSIVTTEGQTTGEFTGNVKH